MRVVFRKSAWKSPPERLASFREQNISLNRFPCSGSVVHRREIGAGDAPAKLRRALAIRASSMHSHEFAFCIAQAGCLIRRANIKGKT